MATHSSILAWRIPWTEEPGGLQSMGSQSQTRLSDLGQILYLFWVSLSSSTEIMTFPCQGHCEDSTCLRSGEGARLLRAKITTSPGSQGAQPLP